jgi:hypothetical protein
VRSAIRNLALAGCFAITNSIDFGLLPKIVQRIPDCRHFR